MSVSCDVSSLLISYILAHSLLVSLGEVVVGKLALRDLFTGVVFRAGFPGGYR